MECPYIILKTENIFRNSLEAFSGKINVIIQCYCYCWFFIIIIALIIIYGKVIITIKTKTV